MLFITICSCGLRMRASVTFASDEHIAPAAAGSVAFSFSFSTTMSQPVRLLVIANTYDCNTSRSEPPMMCCPDSANSPGRQYAKAIANESGSTQVAFDHLGV